MVSSWGSKMCTEYLVLSACSFIPTCNLAFPHHLATVAGLMTLFQSVYLSLSHSYRVSWFGFTVISGIYLVVSGSRMGPCLGPLLCGGAISNPDTLASQTGSYSLCSTQIEQ